MVVLVETILQKVDEMFDDALSVETLLEQFYTARQDVSEDTTMWAQRLAFHDLIVSARIWKLEVVC